MEQMTQKQEDKKVEAKKEKEQEKCVQVDNDGNTVLTKELLAILINRVQEAQGTGINTGQGQGLMGQGTAGILPVTNPNMVCYQSRQRGTMQMHVQTSQICYWPNISSYNWERNHVEYAESGCIQKEPVSTRTKMHTYDPQDGSPPIPEPEVPQQPIQKPGM